MEPRKLFNNSEIVATWEEIGKPCVSIILPTHRVSPDRRIDKLLFEKAIAKAKEYLKINFGFTETLNLCRSIDELFQKIDFNHNQDGIGLFVSPSLKQLVHFPFPVQEKVIIGDSFEIRDLLLKKSYSIQHFLLVLSEKNARLFEGSFSDYEEIIDVNFPKNFNDDYEYSQPSRGNSYAGTASTKSYEKDKTIIEEIRLKRFFSEADKLLKMYLTEKTPLLISGLPKNMALFESITSYGKQIVGKISGNYTNANHAKFANLSLMQLKTFFNKNNEKLIEEFEDKAGKGLGIEGIIETWSAAKDGKGFTLLVEKDYKCPAFIDKNGKELHLRPFKKFRKITTDAVDDVIEMVLNKKGNVVFVENGMLKDHQHISLITRY